MYPGIDYSNMELVDEMYARYEQDPSSVDDQWRKFFQNTKPQEYKYATTDLGNLIDAYRKYGHLIAKVNPIAVHDASEPAELMLENLGFKQQDLNHNFPTNGILDKPQATLSEIIGTLRKIYCDKIGLEYMDLGNPEIEQWIQERIEPTYSKLSIDQKRLILQHLNKSELLEVFIHTKYVGQKRFSLEGGETLIPMLAAIVDSGGEMGIDDVVIGMAHRGRLNVLSNILDKSYTEIFSEFEEGYIPESFEGSGDVKYHKGFYSEIKTIHGKKMQLTLTPNPSHLEAVDAVVEGQAKAKQVHKKDIKQEKVLPILIHGDAALSGQGVVYETMQLYKLDGYSTGGTVHIVINNQIGFTTLPRDGRSTHYCTDIARAFGAPVFHVNAEDPEGCVMATLMALDLRQKFHIDVFIDLNCYRKYGHNESDEPAFTQPTEYQLIRKKSPIREIYRDELIQQGVVEKAMAEQLEEEFKKSLAEALAQAKAPLKPLKKIAPNHLPMSENAIFEPLETGVSPQILRDVADAACFIPKGFHIHRKLQKLIEDRLAMVREDSPNPIDWGMAEMLAIGTLLWHGVHVRLAGQDSCRGTFSHRHGLWMDQEEEKAYIPLQHLKEGQGRFDLINSPLSEYAVLGFEYGYSLAYQKALIMWEAQFGDFSNGAQVIIDQFITTSEQKWGQVSALTMLLPHGYEGQGPEHSSGRLERFLALCGNNNIQVVYPTTPAQFFHLLRRQVLRPLKKPLIAFTPKGLLRLPECVSPFSEFTQGCFQDILEEPQKHHGATRLVFCSGRVYYDLISERSKRGDDTMAIIRIEQIYPLNEVRLQEIISKYANAREFIWVQEEPNNMGAWSFIAPRLLLLLPRGSDLKYIGRERSASPAAGSYALHKKQYQQIFEGLFGKEKPTIFEIASRGSI